MFEKSDINFDVHVEQKSFASIPFNVLKSKDLKMNIHDPPSRVSKANAPVASNDHRFNCSSNCGT